MKMLIPVFGLLLSFGPCAVAQPIDSTVPLCPLALEYDYFKFERDYMREAKVALEAALAPFSRNAPDFDDAHARERAFIAMSRALALAREFRADHPGDFTCTLNDPTDRQTVLRSSEIDGIIASAVDTIHSTTGRY